jgi:cation diffusion facilitator CzcD-associated flavoprotein CzcO
MQYEEINMNTLNKPQYGESKSANQEYPLIIIGAGVNGLAAAYELKKSGAEPVIFDGSDKPAAAWRDRHDQLKLNTHRLISHLPGMRIPKKFGAFPSRNDIVKYLEEYEAALDVPIHRGVRVNRIDPMSDGWQLSTTDGSWSARQVVIATGHERVPIIPAWPGRDGFAGNLIHAANFGRIERFQGQRILVVGAGNSGTDVLNHLVRIRTEALWVSVRNGPSILPKRLLGIPLQLLSPLMAPLPAWSVDLMMAATQWLTYGNLKKFNLPRHPDGVATRLINEGVAPAFDDGFVAALKSGRVKVLPEVKRFEGDAVYLSGGEAVRPDAVVCATGYSPGLESMVGHLGILDASGHPIINGAESMPEFKGLWFMGMRPRLPGVFYAARHEGRELAVAIKQKEKERTQHALIQSPALSV